MLINLHYEFQPNIPLVGETLVEFAHDEIEFLEEHEYFTREANLLFHYKPDNIAYLKAVVATGHE